MNLSIDIKAEIPWGEQLRAAHAQQEKEMRRKRVKYGYSASFRPIDGIIAIIENEDKTEKEREEEIESTCVLHGWHRPTLPWDKKPAARKAFKRLRKAPDDDSDDDLDVRTAVHDPDFEARAAARAEERGAAITEAAARAAEPTLEESLAVLNEKREAVWRQEQYIAQHFPVTGMSGCFRQPEPTVESLKVENMELRRERQQQQQAILALRKQLPLLKGEDVPVPVYASGPEVDALRVRREALEDRRKLAHGAARLDAILDEAKMLTEEQRKALKGKVAGALDGAGVGYMDYIRRIRQVAGSKDHLVRVRPIIDLFREYLNMGAGGQLRFTRGTRVRAPPGFCEASGVPVDPDGTFRLDAIFKRNATDTDPRKVPHMWKHFNDDLMSKHRASAEDEEAEAGADKINTDIWTYDPMTNYEMDTIMVIDDEAGVIKNELVPSIDCDKLREGLRRQRNQIKALMEAVREREADAWHHFKARIDTKGEYAAPQYAQRPAYEDKLQISKLDAQEWANKRRLTRFK